MISTIDLLLHAILDAGSEPTVAKRFAELASAPSSAVWDEVDLMCVRHWKYIPDAHDEHEMALSTASASALLRWWSRRLQALQHVTLPSCLQLSEL